MSPLPQSSPPAAPPASASALAAPIAPVAGLRTFPALWGVLGVLLLLGQAMRRLGVIALDALRTHRLTAPQLALLVGWTALIGYAEGYQAFQRRFAPRVVARAAWLGAHPRPLHVVLAPLYCMALLHAARRRLVASWLLLVGVVALVVLVRQAPQPYRGIIDGGVVVALAWGALAVVVYYARGLAGHDIHVEPELPEFGESPR